MPDIKPSGQWHLFTLKRRFRGYVTALSQVCSNCVRFRRLVIAADNTSDVDEESLELKGYRNKKSAKSRKRPIAAQVGGKAASRSGDAHQIWCTSHTDAYVITRLWLNSDRMNRLMPSPERFCDLAADVVAIVAEYLSTLDGRPVFPRTNKPCLLRTYRSKGRARLRCYEPPNSQIFHEPPLYRPVRRQLFYNPIREECLVIRQLTQCDRPSVAKHSRQGRTNP